MKTHATPTVEGPIPYLPMRTVDGVEFLAPVRVRIDATDELPRPEKWQGGLATVVLPGGEGKVVPKWW